MKWVIAILIILICAPAILLLAFFLVIIVLTIIMGILCFPFYALFWVVELLSSTHTDRKS